jgi:hypothetical protein
MNLSRYYNPALKFFAAAVVIFCALVFLRSTTGMSSAAAPSAHKAVLVELFTSEGCSSCPPADALLGTLRQDLAKEGFNVIPLGFHVDYWNSLGWKDRFSSAEFSRRQEQYARALRLDGPYTPQMVVDGTTEFVGSERQRAKAVIAESAAHAAGASIEASFTAPGKLTLKAVSASNGAAVMLAITEDNLSTRIGAGENSGRELHHAAVVRQLRQLGIIQNGNFAASVPLALEKEWKRGDLRVVVFVQQGAAGLVLGTASVPLQAEPR